MSQPREGPFHHPSALDDHKAAGDFGWLDALWNPHIAYTLKGAFHNFQRPAQGFLHPLLQFAFISAVGPQVRKAWKDLLEGSQKQFCSLSICDAGGMHQYVQDQSSGIHDQMALASAELLSTIIAPLSSLLASLDRLTIKN